MSNRVPAWFFAAALCCLPGACSAQAPVPIGTLSGGSYRVRGDVPVTPDGKAVLTSGARLEVDSGVVSLAFTGGQARLCGPLKLTVLKSASALGERGEVEDLPLLFALESGALEIDYTSGVTHAVQTAFFAISIVPSGRQDRKLAVRVEPNGDSCIASLAGTLRIREQIGTAQMVIPAGHALRVPATGVEKAEPAGLADCGCAPAPAAPAQPTPPAPPQKQGPEALPATKTTIATAPLVYNAEEAAAQPKATREPVITLPVVTSNAPPDTVPDTKAPAETKVPAAAQASAPAAPAPKPATGFGARIKGFFRSLLGLKKPAQQQTR